jgi:hypothetical protein
MLSLVMEIQRSKELEILRHRLKENPGEKDYSVEI